MKRHVSTIPLLAALLIVSLCAGCVRLTGEVYRQAQDPGPFVQVTSVDDATVTLESGEELRIRGISTEGLTTDQRRLLSEWLEELLKEKAYERVALVEQEGGKVTLELSRPVPFPKWNFAGITLFPKVVEIGPMRQDVAASILNYGLAKADVSDVHDQQRKDWYLLAEREARENHNGIWGLQEMFFGRSRLAVGMTRQELLEQIRLSRKQYDPLEDEASHDRYVQQPPDEMVQSNGWLLTCPSRNSRFLGGGSGIILQLRFEGDRLIGITELSWVAG